MYLNMDIRTVGDMGQLPDTLPIFLWPEVPLNFETLMIILPYAVALTVVGLLESMMTATIVDDLTDTKSDRNRECKGQGIANISSGLLGGMAGCAMIGQSIINIKSGGRTRLSSVVVVATHNLAFGVLAGVLLAALFFANKVGHYMLVTSEYDEASDTRTYNVVGQVFFSSSEKFTESFDFKEATDNVVIDLSRAHFWDITAVAALDKAVVKFRREGAEVEVIGLNEASATIVDRFGVHDKPDAVERLKAH